MEWLTLIYGRYTLVFKYWKRLILMDDNRLTKAAFNVIYISAKITVAPELNNYFFNIRFSKVMKINLHV